MKFTIGRSLAAGAIFACLALPGCTAPVAVSFGDTVVLRLATIDGSVDPSGLYVVKQAFLDSLDDVSGGRMTVDLTTTYGGGAVTAESGLVKAIVSGDIDGGWPSSRAFWRAGIGSIRALEAPMMITSVAAEKALVSGPIADKVISRLRGSGIVAVGLGVGPLRRPFAAGAPLLGPDDWHRAGFASSIRRCRPTRSGPSAALR